MSEVEIVSTGIEKTGVMTTSACLVKWLGHEAVWVYFPPAERFLPSGVYGHQKTPETQVKRDLERMFTKFPVVYPLVMRLYYAHLTRKAKEIGLKPEDLPDQDLIRVVHGHFVTSDLDKIFPEAQNIAVMRDPLDRMISHYLHWRGKRGITGFRVQIPFDRKNPMGFRDFAWHPDMQDYQTGAMGGISPGEFDLIGVTENFDAFAHQLATMIGVSIDPELAITPYNVGLWPVDLKSLGIPEEPREFRRYKEEFRDRHQNDYRAYDEAWKIVQQYERD